MEAEKEKVEKVRRFRIQKNFGFTKIDILEGNIGYENRCMRDSTETAQFH
jgi:hypothetical protein